MRQVGTRKMSVSRTAVDVSITFEGASKPWPCSGLWELGSAGVPITGRAVSGIEAA